jgi:hypothetical protein
VISRLVRLAVPDAVAIVVIVSASVSLGAGPPAPTVHLRGTAYEFNNTKTLLGGATIRVAEYPKLKATVGRDGRYDLLVPDHARVTPYIVDRGYHTIYLQTFKTDGEDLANVNFQTPTEPIYRALAALLKVPLDSHGNLLSCAIVSTFSTRNVRDVSFERFTAYGAHGVAGATASATPSLPKPVYFNKDVVPDPAQATSSEDGGVVWTGVPSGVYKINALDPATRFAGFVATCRRGRVINANPPWGLYQLGLRNPARVTARWSRTRAGTTAASLMARKLPAGAAIRVSCTGRGCPFVSRTFRPHGSAFDVRGAIGRGQLRLTTGDRIEVTVSAHPFNGVVVRWVVARGHIPTPVWLCVPLGYTSPRPSCASG